MLPGRDEFEGAPPSRETVLVQLEKIVASSSFANSPQLCRFLRYVVEQELEGNGEQLKEYSLGLQVFRKDDTFDPRIDTVVRTEARRLRTKLAEFYLADGRDDEVEIQLPKGRYRPVVRRRHAAAPAPPTAPKRHRPTKLVAASVALVVVAAAVYWAATRLPRAGARAVYTSIAVLPFVDISPQHDQEYFCDGLTEELINSMSSLDGLHVAARTSVFEFKRKAEDIRKIGSQLNVQTVLEGSVRKDGEHLRITAQLISVSDGYHVWSETYDQEWKDVFEIQERIARSVVEAMRVTLRGGSERRLARRYKPSPVSYNLYLTGRHQLAQRPDKDSLYRAIRFFDLALKEDPNLALAYAGLADSYTQLALWDYRAPREVMPNARDNADIALERDDTLAEAHVSRALVRALYEYRPKDALQEFQRATELNRGYAPAHWAYAMYLEAAGQTDKAMKELTLASELDPLSVGIGSDMAGFVFERGDHERAVGLLRALMASNPDALRVQLALAEALLRTGNRVEAIAILEKARDAYPNYPRVLGALGLAYGTAGRSGDANRILDLLTRSRRLPYVPSYDVAIVYMGLGEQAEALAWLDKACEERHGWLVLWSRSHLFDDLRIDDRFPALRRKMGWEH